jgi:hypothetical protein
VENETAIDADTKAVDLFSRISPARMRLISGGLASLPLFD